MITFIEHLNELAIIPEIVKDQNLTGNYLFFNRWVTYEVKMENGITTVDEYINNFPEDIQKLLKKIRAIIKEKAPEAIESINYGMPAYKTNNKPLVYFAGFKNHIGFYATPTGHFEFKEELSKYKHGKGSVQFPLNKPIPFDLIAKIVEFRVLENNINFV